MRMCVCVCVCARVFFRGNRRDSAAIETRGRKSYRSAKTIACGGEPGVHCGPNGSKTALFLVRACFDERRGVCICDE